MQLKIQNLKCEIKVRAWVKKFELHLIRIAGRDHGERQSSVVITAEALSDEVQIVNLWPQESHTE